MDCKYLSLIFFILFVSRTNGSTFFVPDSDTATLLEIAMIVSKDLKTTLQLLEVAKGTQEALGKFHDSVGRKYYLSQRIMYRLERIKRLKNAKPKTLREINNALFQFKSLFRSLRRLYADAGMELIKTEDELLEIENKKAEIKTNKSLLDSQENNSINGGNILENTSNAAINTAQANILLNDLNGNVLDGNKYQLINNKFQLMEFMKKVEQEERIRKWGGLDDYDTNESSSKKDKQ